MGQPTMPPPGRPTALGKAWGWFRSLPMWAQAIGWLFLLPLLAALLIASPPTPSRARYGTAAAVLLIGGAWWVSLGGEDPVGPQELAVEEDGAEMDDGNDESDPEPGEKPTDGPTEEPEAEPTPEPAPAPSETGEPDPEPTADEDDNGVQPETVSAGWTVVNIVDGDTLDVRSADGTEERVRVVGIDTPERGECGYGEASVALADVVMGAEVTLVASAQDDRDHYNRLLRYVDVGDTDAGLVLVEQGLARARYDSRDGYGRHPREDAYVSADEAMPDITCEFEQEPEAEPTPEPTQAAPEADPQPEPETANPWGASSCHAAYTPCVPPVSEVGDLNCPDIRAKHPSGVSVDHAHGDPHGLDGDNDGGGCE